MVAFQIVGLQYDKIASQTDSMFCMLRSFGSSELVAVVMVGPTYGDPSVACIDGFPWTRLRYFEDCPNHPSSDAVRLRNKPSLLAVSL